MLIGQAELRLRGWREVHFLSGMYTTELVPYAFLAPII